MSTTRIHWIDVVKGIGILLVVLQHCISGDLQQLNKAILAFHMPLFFFLSGLCYKWKAPKDYLTSKTCSLLLPLICMFAINAPIYVFFEYLGMHHAANGLQLGGQWFLFALCVITVTYFLADHSLKSKAKELENRLGSLLLLSFALVICVFGLYITWGYKVFSQCCVGAFFFSLGVFAKQCRISDATILSGAIPRCAFALGSVFLGCVLWILAQMNVPVLMVDNLYGKKSLFLISATIGILMGIGGGISINHSKFLEYFGKRSLVILLVHFPVMRLLGYLFNRFDFWRAHSTLEALAVFMITVGCMVPITTVIEKYFPILAGKYRFHDNIA